MHPFEIGNDHAAGITENIGNHKHFIPALLENPVRFGRGRTVGGFGQDAALQFGRVFLVNHAIDCRRHQHVALHGEQLVWIDMLGLGERAQVSFFEHVLLGRFDIDPFWIVERDHRITDADHFKPSLECERKRRN